MYTIVIFIATDINENKYRIELRLGFDCSTEMLDSHAFTLYSSIFFIFYDNSRQLDRDDSSFRKCQVRFVVTEKW